MAVESGQKVTYSDLYNSVVNKIKSTCANVDGYSNVPYSMQNGHSFSESFSKEVGYTATMNYASELNSVSLSTVTSDLDRFLSDRGLVTKSTTLITAKGVLNFYANIAVFLNARFMAVSDIYGNTRIFYKSGSVSYISVANDHDVTTGLSPDDVKYNLDALVNSISYNRKAFTPKYSYVLNCSCSSCSSSSSSSSCSSSSTFISFMEI